MKRIALLVLAAGIAGCDSGVEPPPEPVPYVITVSGASNEAIGAALVSVSGSTEDVVVGSGWGLTMPTDDGTVIAAIVAVSGTRVEIELELLASAGPTVELLQVADGTNAVYGDLGTFTVDVRERDQP